jgi:hypothetical protein
LTYAVIVLPRCFAVGVLCLAIASCGNDLATQELGPATVRYPDQWNTQELDREIGWNQSVVMRPPSSEEWQTPFVQLAYTRGGRRDFEAEITAHKRSPYPSAPLDIDVPGASETYGYREDGLVSYIHALSKDERFLVFLQVNARDTDELDVERVIDSLKLEARER